MTAPLLSDYSFADGVPNQIELQIVYLEEHTTPSSYVMPDVVSVEVQFGADIPPKLIQVPIVRAMPEKKPYLGGFRSRRTAACVMLVLASALATFYIVVLRPKKAEQKSAPLV